MHSGFKVSFESSKSQFQHYCSHKVSSPPQGWKISPTIWLSTCLHTPRLSTCLSSGLCPPLESQLACLLACPPLESQLACPPLPWLSTVHPLTVHLGVRRKFSAGALLCRSGQTRIEKQFVRIFSTPATLDHTEPHWTTPHWTTLDHTGLGTMVTLGHTGQHPPHWTKLDPPGVPHHIYSSSSAFGNIFEATWWTEYLPQALGNLGIPARCGY